MMKQLTTFFWVSLFATSSVFGQKSNDFTRIDSLIHAESQKPFNGVILISQNGKTAYFKKQGYSDLEKKTVLKDDSQFVIGSVSKQITAVMILQEYEKGHIQLHEPIKAYLPELTQGWADSVTVHDLLCHTHGVVDFNKLSLFPAGSQYLYSQIGYEILSDIVERINNDSFANLSLKLFRKIGMNNTFHPESKYYKDLVKSYNEDENGVLIPETEKTKYAPAGGFISTANDLLTWNDYLYNGKLLQQSTFDLMTTKQPNAVRNHPIFGETSYGYGITVDTNNDIQQLGQTGYVPGSVCMSFYFPESKVGVIVLENIAYDADNIKETFFYHTAILNMVRDNLSK
ncbi:CubicO group peptidase (beta-lactamase class C family) [Dysgonomonas alginatilytica]|uniref:CubicO group peptidase (Beta-lactamase class C family) n=1 Tax=Dysgonomonas alginatilytica TaxID=1605892 RepID=A0A2V3PP77_9BACT|nr:serine hydrolase domain-containing protein [Dysgonomonas alginatilytica]PXV62806.1 CubicO group peptidase (beta-lactamase class C family) [Dysgonomonas alginatilytica]